MTFRATILLIVTVCLSETVHSQQAGVLNAHNAVYIELGGPGMLYSVNYEYRIVRQFSLRAGFTIWKFPFLIASVDMMAAPVMINLLLGGRHANLEIGIGLLAGRAAGEWLIGGGSLGETTFVVGTGTIGYRHQSIDGGFVFRIGFTPVFSSDGLLPAFGLSMGHSF